MALQTVQYVTTGFSLLAFLAALLLLGFRSWLRAKAAAIATAPESKKVEIVSIVNEWVPVDLQNLSPETRDRVAILQVQMRAQRELVRAALLFCLAVTAAIAAVLITKQPEPPAPKPPDEGSRPVSQTDDKNAVYAQNSQNVVNSFRYQATDPDYNGPQFWKRISPVGFVESKYSDFSGEKTYFEVVKRINYAECDGVVVAKIYSPNFQMFIPERNCPSMEIKFRRLPNKDWIDLKSMQDVE